MKGNKGFTLIEISIILVIVTVGVLMAGPSFLRMVSGTSLKQGTVELSSFLKLARTAAMGRNQTVVVTVTLVGGSVQYSSAGVFQTETLAEEIVAFTGGPVSFNSLGLRQGGGNANQLITLTDEEGTVYSVVVTPGGRVDWCTQATCT